MSSSAQWRINGVMTYAGGDLELSAFHLYNGDVRVDESATLVCSHAPVEGLLLFLQGTDTTKVCRWPAEVARSPGFFLRWDFSTPTQVAGIRVGSTSNDLRALADATLEYYDTTWHPEGLLSLIPWPGAQTLGPKLKPIKKQKTRYFRLFIESNNGSEYTSLNEVRLLSGEVNRALYCATTQSSYFGPGSSTASRAVDGNTTDYVGSVWVSETGAAFPHWLTFDLGGEYLIDSLQLFPQNWAEGPARAPRSFSLQSSDYPSGPWRDILSVTGATGWTAGSGRTWAVESSVQTGLAPRRTPTALSTFDVAAGTTVPTFSTRKAPALATARDVEHGGPGTIYGTTKTKGAPNLPTKARVVLLHQRSKLPVRETWSDPVTGYFEFRGIDVNQQFLTLAEDAAGNFRPVAANRLTPEVL